MQISNPLQMNDWGIKKFLTAVLVIQLVVWGVIGLDAVDLQIPVIRQLVGIIYLFFIPGVIILRILKLHKLSNIETLLYSVGLSLATVMFVGVLIDTVYPLFGISAPISLTPLIITISAIILALCAICYVRDRNFSDPCHIDIKGILSSPVLFLCLIPFLSIFGTYLVNFHQNNILLLLLIIIIALTALLIGFNKFIPQNLYPLAVFVIAISLLFHRSLISMYISGFDIHEEYYFANLVKTASYWDPTSPFLLNGMLSITMLAPISSIISDINFTWVFKVIYPLLFSLVPIGLYQVFRKQTDERIAFLSCFFFMSVSHFYTGVAVLLRQQVATLFLVLLILLMIDKKMGGAKRAFLFIVFGASLAVSHYGLSYIYMFYLIFAWLILVLMDNPTIRGLIDNLYAKLGIYNNEKPAGKPIPSKAGGRTINSAYVLSFVIFALAWYVITSSSMVFNVYIGIGLNIARNITEFLNPEASQGLTILLTQPKPGLLQTVNAIINYLNQIFIIIGILVLLRKHRELNFEREYATFSTLSLAVVAAGVLVPFLTMTANMERLYHIALIFLAPIFIIGATTVFRMIGRVVKAPWKNEKMRKLLKVSTLSVISVYLVIFFWYQTGFVWQMTRDYSGSVSLNQEWIKESDDIEAKVRFYTNITPEQEIFSAKWLYMHMEPGEKVYATYSDARVHALTSYGMMPAGSVIAMTRRTETISEDAYIYLRYLNVVEGIVTEFDPRFMHKRERTIYNMAEISHLFAGKNKIYSNGGSEIFK